MAIKKVITWGVGLGLPFAATAGCINKDSTPAADLQNCMDEMNATPECLAQATPTATPAVTAPATPTATPATPTSVVVSGNATPLQALALEPEYIAAMGLDNGTRISADATKYVFADNRTEDITRNHSVKLANGTLFKVNVGKGIEYVSATPVSKGAVFNEYVGTNLTFEKIDAYNTTTFDVNNTVLKNAIKSLSANATSEITDIDGMLNRTVRATFTISNGTGYLTPFQKDASGKEVPKRPYAFDFDRSVAIAAALEKAKALA